MILVLTGTHEQPFDRLVRAAEALAVDTGEEVVVQRGASRVPAPHCRVEELIPHREVLALMEEARLVITHGGPATLLEAARYGVPVVVPRSPAYGEHVDDHQLRFCRRLADRVRVVEDPETLPSVVRGWQGGAEVAAISASAEALARSVEAFSEAVEGLGEWRDASAYRRIRATITLLSRRRRRRR